MASLTDKRATEAMAANAEAESARLRSGLADPKAVAYAAHDSRPLAERVEA